MNITAVGPVFIAHLDDSYSGLAEESVHQTEAAIHHALEGVSAPRLVVDFSGTRYFSSYFLEMLIRVWRAVQAAGGQFAIAGLSPNCRTILTTSRFDRLWTIVDTVPDAVALLSR